MDTNLRKQIHFKTMYDDDETKLKIMYSCLLEHFGHFK